MSRHASTSADPLVAVRGTAPLRTQSVRDLAAFAQIAGCDLAALAFASGTDLDRVLTDTSFEVPFGQSPFAIQRGNRFEQQVGADANFGPLLGLLQTELNFAATEVRVLDLRQLASADRDRSKRAHDTKAALRDMLRGDPQAFNLVAGAILEVPLLGRTVRFEADALAFQVGGELRVLEIKSFPTVDGRADPEKAGAAFDQVATYIVVLRQIVTALGADPARVSAEGLLVTPRNTGMQPVLHRLPIGGRVERIERILVELPHAEALASRVPAGATFGAVADAASPEADRVKAFAKLADGVGTLYAPSCLQICGAARLCRARAQAAGSPALCGSRAVRDLPGVASLVRAAELAAGAPATAGEAAAAAKLSLAGRTFERARGVA
jgi:hypothetical protein